MNTTLLILTLLFPTLVFLIYICCPKRIRPYILLVFSLIFYIIYSKFMTIFLLLTIVTVYLGARQISTYNKEFASLKEGLSKEERKALKSKFTRKKRLVVGLIVFGNILFMALLQYFGVFSSIFEGFISLTTGVKFSALHLIAPLGLAYYTLSSIGYLIDVGRGKYEAGRFIEVALFIGYFPQLYMGPFARFDELTPQLMASKGFDGDNFFKGIMKIIWGFFKKVVIADRLAILVSAVFASYSQYGGGLVVLAIIFFTFELYAEFSGFIDIASGISLMFNINLAKNFEQPFFSQSVNEFWRRWHISLGAWLKDYVFYPVSMSHPMTALNKKLQDKVPTFFQVFLTSTISLFFVWLINGLWHGQGSDVVKYITYGMYYYVIMLIGMLFEGLMSLIYKKCKINKNNFFLCTLRVIRTFILVNIGMLIFRAPTLLDGAMMFKQCFSGGSYEFSSFIDIFDFVLCFVGILIVIIQDILNQKKIYLTDKLSKTHIIVKMLSVVVMITIIFIFGAYGEGYVAPDPIYGAG